MNITEDELRQITLQAIDELGEKASPETVKKVVTEIIQKSGETVVDNTAKQTESGKVILTSFGLNHPGIVAGITQTLAGTNCDIMDISQKILSDFYTMIMVVDISNANVTLQELQQKMNAVADKLKIKIYIQHEDVFKHMHRV